MRRDVKDHAYRAPSSLLDVGAGVRIGSYINIDTKHRLSHADKEPTCTAPAPAARDSSSALMTGHEPRGLFKLDLPAALPDVNSSSKGSEGL